MIYSFGASKELVKDIRTRERTAGEDARRMKTFIRFKVSRVRERGVWHLDAVFGFVLTKNDLLQFNLHYDQD